MLAKETVFVASVVLLIVANLASLVTGLYYLLNPVPGQAPVLKYLSLRISLSIFLFLALFLLFRAHYIQPHDLAG